MQKFHSNGKLLLAGEYVVLNGATALVLPTKYGQTMEVVSSEKEEICWKSIDENRNVWFENNFQLKDGDIISGKNPDKITAQLLRILRQAKKLNPEFLTDAAGFKIKTNLDFSRNWGLGTSSTLINNIAQWAKVDPFVLLGLSFGGSGFDIAAAQNDFSILYELKNGRPTFRKAQLPWDFTDALFFVHLNRKQNSKDGIAHYKTLVANSTQIQRISDISIQLLQCYTLPDFEKLMNEHEEIISKITNQLTIKSQLFNDYPHTIKSLGAWGGDFVLVTGNYGAMDYFRKKGYETIVPFEKMYKGSP